MKAEEIEKIKSLFADKKRHIKELHSDFLRENEELLSKSQNTPNYKHLYIEIVGAFHKYIEVFVDALDKPAFSMLQGFTKEDIHRCSKYYNAYMKVYTLLESDKSLEATGWKIHTWNCILAFEQVEKEILNRLNKTKI